MSDYRIENKMYPVRIHTEERGAESSSHLPEHNIQIRDKRADGKTF